MNFLEALEANKTRKVRALTEFGPVAWWYGVGELVIAATQENNHNSLKPLKLSFFQGQWESEPEKIVREVLMGKKANGSVYIHENRDYFDIQKFLPVGDTSCRITIEVLS